MGGAFRARGGDEKCIKIVVGMSDGTDHLADLGVLGGKAILKLIFRQ
jgi:hypothetical protein